MKREKREKRDKDPLRRRLMLALNMTRVVQHVWQAIRFENAETLTPVFDRDHAKRRFLDEWVAAVNAHRGFGRWRWAVSRKPGDVHDILERHSSASAP